MLFRTVHDHGDSCENEWQTFKELEQGADIPSPNQSSWSVLILRPVMFSRDVLNLIKMLVTSDLSFKRKKKKTMWTGCTHRENANTTYKPSLEVVKKISSLLEY